MKSQFNRAPRSLLACVLSLSFQALHTIILFLRLRCGVLGMRQRHGLWALARRERVGSDETGKIRGEMATVSDWPK